MLQNAGSKKIKNSKKPPTSDLNQSYYLSLCVNHVCWVLQITVSEVFLGCIFWLCLCYELLHSLLGFLEVGGCVVYICGLIVNSFPENIQYLKFQLGWLAVNAHICCVALFQFLDSMSITTVAVWILKSTDGVWKAPDLQVPLAKTERDRSHSGVWTGHKDTNDTSLYFLR